MTAWKPLAVSLMIGAMLATSVKADAISWPGGLDNWTIYLAAPTGNTGSGPISYPVPPAPAVASQAAPAAAVYTPPAPVQPVTQPAPSAQPHRAGSIAASSIPAGVFAAGPCPTRRLYPGSAAPTGGGPAPGKHPTRAGATRRGPGARHPARPSRHNQPSFSPSPTFRRPRPNR